MKMGVKPISLILIISSQVQKVLSFSIPGLLPREYSTQDKLSVMWTSHLTSSGRHRVINIDDEPRFIETTTEYYGLNYNL
jgi:hypothetical protein